MVILQLDAESGGLVQGRGDVEKRMRKYMLPHILSKDENLELAVTLT